ncbi:MAG: sugar phosphorylase, partial [Gammaproteobacteria bacterium]|nr:sugar phosphorylase [Gammaproteobacteria bacterium]
MENKNLEERINSRIQLIYGKENANTITQKILKYIEDHKEQRTRSVTGPLWTYGDIVLITYGDTIQSATRPPLQTLRSFLNLHLPTEFSMVHILPFFPWSSDDGFSITDFRSVNPELGDWNDIKALEECYDLVIDLVLNHCSRENLWFTDYIAGKESVKDFFIEMDPATNLSMVTRPRSSPVLTGVRTREGMKHVWATFSNDQIDFNYGNPDVLIAFLDILLFYFRQGARMVRLDAVAYLWKEVGTKCIHLPQTHEVIKLFRDVLREIEPGALIMTETNVPHAENISYFGDGDEANVVYQFSLPPLLLHAILSGNIEYLHHWAHSLEELELPPGCTFLNFTASHDGVGMRPLEGLVPDDEVDKMMATLRERGAYISTRKNPDGRETPYELNISYFDAFREPNAQNSQWHIPMFLLSQLFALSFKGIPAIYIHSLFATPNDKMGVERTGMTRSINRRKWDRGELENLIASHESETGRVFSDMKKILRTRRRQTAFHPDGAQTILDLPDNLFGILRTAPDESQ